MSRTGSCHALRRIHAQDPLRYLGRRPDGRAAGGGGRAGPGSWRSHRCRARLDRRWFPGRLCGRRHRQYPDRGRQTFSAARWVALQSGRWAANHPGRPGARSPPSRFTTWTRGRWRSSGAAPRWPRSRASSCTAARLRRLAGRPCGAHDRRQQPVDAFRSWAVDFFGKERAPEALDGAARPGW